MENQANVTLCPQCAAIPTATVKKDNGAIFAVCPNPSCKDADGNDFQWELKPAPPAVSVSVTVKHIGDE